MSRKKLFEQCDRLNFPMMKKYGLSGVYSTIKNYHSNDNFIYFRKILCGDIQVLNYFYKAHRNDQLNKKQEEFLRKWINKFTSFGAVINKRDMITSFILTKDYQIKILSGNDVLYSISYLEYKLNNEVIQDIFKIEDVSYSTKLFIDVVFRKIDHQVKIYEYIFGD